ncbi:MAG: preprotein translocase subunit SecG, partial [Bacteroidales bacterium]|nr:preprotein translocase subunit SecG [Bacteroidales bacterium]
MYTATAILIVIASILLTLVVLVQNSKGGGLAANFATGNNTFGVRQTADFLEKATWTLAIAILV